MVIQIGFTFLIPAHLDSLGKGSLNGCVSVCVHSLCGAASLKLQDIKLWARRKVMAAYLDWF